MKINEYKNDVGSLKLSQEFKDNLKAMMAEEYENASGKKEAEPDIKMSGTAVFAKKYSKYIALAACLLLAVSAVSAVGLQRLKMGSPFAIANGGTDAAAEVNSAEQRDAEQQDTEVLENYDAPAPDPEAPQAPDGDDDIANAMLYDTQEAPAEEAPAESAAPVVEEDSEDIDAEVNVSDSQPPAEEPATDIPVETNPMSGNDYSAAKSKNYDGDYSGEDYINYYGEGGGYYYASNISNELRISPVEIAPYSLGAGETTPTGANGDGEDIPTDTTSQDDAHVEAPADVPESEDYDTSANVDDAMEIPDTDEMLSDVERNLKLGYSVKYYDVRDGYIADLDNVAIIRFVVEDSLSDETEIKNTVDRKITIDPDNQTLYRIHVGYDYFAMEDPDVDMWLISDGSVKNQLVGRPVMEGEYIAVATMTDEGVMVPVPELVYAVYNVNGLDLAYHVYSAEGFMVDPGDTNMGIYEEETVAYKTAANNPEIYTQKAAVRELTSYLRRNILRMEPNLTVLTDDIPENEEEQPSGEAAEPNGEALTSLTARFPEGTLVYEGGETPSVNGIKVGDYLSDAVKAFYLTSYTFAPDCRIVLVPKVMTEGVPESVTVVFENGVAVSIEAKTN